MTPADMLARATELLKDVLPYSPQRYRDSIIDLVKDYEELRYSEPPNEADQIESSEDEKYPEDTRGTITLGGLTVVPRVYHEVREVCSKFGIGGFSRAVDLLKNLQTLPDEDYRNAVADEFYGDCRLIDSVLVPFSEVDKLCISWYSDDPDQAAQRLSEIAGITVHEAETALYNEFGGSE